jgi:hypothetical protein
MNEESEKKTEQTNSPSESELKKRAEAMANFQKALDAMARLRRTIDNRPFGLTLFGKPTMR